MRRATCLQMRRPCHEYERQLKDRALPHYLVSSCGIGLIMPSWPRSWMSCPDKLNTVLVTGIGCTGRMGAYMNFESVYTLHGRTCRWPRPSRRSARAQRHRGGGRRRHGLHWGNHLLHAIRRNPNITVICKQNEIYGLTGGRPARPLRRGPPPSPRGRRRVCADQPARLGQYQPRAYYAKTTVYHRPMRKAIKEAIAWPGFALWMWPVNASRTMAAASVSRPPTHDPELSDPIQAGPTWRRWCWGRTNSASSKA